MNLETYKGHLTTKQPTNGNIIKIVLRQTKAITMFLLLIYEYAIFNWEWSFIAPGGGDS